MFMHLFADYAKSMQQAQQQWWNNSTFANTTSSEDQPISDSLHSSNSAGVEQAMQQLLWQDSQAFFQAAMQNQPAAIMQQQSWWQQQLNIWQQTMLYSGKTVITPEQGDRRFNAPEWQQPHFSFIKQSYLLYARTLLDSITQLESLPAARKERLLFFARQMLNAMSPSNYIMSNPELLQLTLAQQGQNLFKGMAQLQQDIDASNDILNIAMTGKQAFTPGKDVAATPGQVVFTNELFELIRYSPQTETVLQTPLLLVPPFINKYYILDLSAKNSMVDWLVKQGHSVFLISWRNPGKSQQHLCIDDYVLEGVNRAIDAVLSISGQSQCNAAGYCIGGTLLAMTQAYHAAKRMKPRIKSASFFTTLLDFSQPGELGAYINDTLIQALTVQNNERGYFDGRSLSATFSLLRENSLYWHYYIKHYLKGESPVDFDLLFWNSDSTNVAAQVHNFLLRQLYLDNQLVNKRGIKIGGVYLDLAKISQPSCFVSTRDDHIALWQGTLRGAMQLGGEKTFILGESGHIAGIINPPAQQKYGFWQGSALPAGDDSNDSELQAEQWLGQACHQSGSWWPSWHQWLCGHSPKKRVKPPADNHGQYPNQRPAPGQYVMQTLPISEAKASL